MMSSLILKIKFYYLFYTAYNEHIIMSRKKYNELGLKGKIFIINFLD